MTSNDLLGVHMIGPHVTDLISEAGLARVLDATPWEIAQAPFTRIQVYQKQLESSTRCLGRCHSWVNMNNDKRSKISLI